MSRFVHSIVVGKNKNLLALRENEKKPPKKKPPKKKPSKKAAK